MKPGGGIGSVTPEPFPHTPLLAHHTGKPQDTHHSESQQDATRTTIRCSHGQTLAAAECAA